MVNKEAAKVLVDYSQHIAQYAAIADVTTEDDTVLTKAARNHAWRLLSALITFAEAAKESDMYWLLLEIAIRDGKSDRECGRLRSIAKSEDRNFMQAKEKLAEMLKDIRATERADPKGKKRQAEADARDRKRAEAEVARAEQKKAEAKARRDAKKAETAAANAAVFAKPAAAKRKKAA